MSTFLTENRHGYSVQFSPFNANLLAVATSQYYGFAGGGSLFLLENSNRGSLRPVKTFQWTDGLFDLVWSEIDPNLVISASGDGSLQLWSLTADQKTPLMRYHEHTKEVYSVNWSKGRQDQLVLSASWDCSIKLWDPIRLNSLSTFRDHKQLVYAAKFSNAIPNAFASVSGDGHLKIWSTLLDKPTISLRAHAGEILTCDWCQYDLNVIATGGSDCLIKGWDLRYLSNQPIFELSGCEYAVRRIQFSPFDLSRLVSVAYDFTTRIWDFKRDREPLETIRHHSEFTYGLDWNRLCRNQLADCGWDSLVHVFTPKSLNRLDF